MDEITPDKPKRRRLKLSKEQRAEIIQQRQVEHAVALFLDLEQDRSVQQIADEVGLSLSSLKRLTQTAAFRDCYEDAMLTIGHHPRMLALQAGLPELIPLAHRALKRMLSPGTAHTAQVQAIKLLYDTLKVSEMQAAEDPQPLNNFLAAHGVKVEGDLVMNVNLPIPKEYQEAFERLMGKPGNIIDVEARPLEALEGPEEADELT